MPLGGNSRSAAYAAASLAYTAPGRLVRDFAARGLVVLPPETLGLPAELHRRIRDKQKQALLDNRPVGTSAVREMFEVLTSPGLVAACNELVGENWAIVPYFHATSFPSGAFDQHWHKDDNATGNGRKQRHHQAVQIEMLYYPQDVGPEMGPTATIPYSHYWTYNHEENNDNFSGADHMDFMYMLGGMERQPVSGPDSTYDIDDVVNGRTAHDVRLRDAVRNTGWPLVEPFEAAPLRAGSVVLYSHNLFHRGNHRRDDWRTWRDNPRFMWRFSIYRTTDPDPARDAPPVDWDHPGADPLTGIDLSEAGPDVTEVWRYHHHWMLTGQAPPAREPAGSRPADDLFAQLHAKHDEAEPLRIGAAYRLASIGDTSLATRLLGRALYDERESVRRAATYGLVAVGPDATQTFIDATTYPVKWVRKAGVYGLGDAAPLTEEVLRAVVARLETDPSVYVRSVAAGALGCLGRRAIATGVGTSLVPACVDALVQSLSREEDRPAMDRAQGRSIKFVRPTDDSDVCEGYAIDFGLERFQPVRSMVRENALWSMVILCSHGPHVVGALLEPAARALEEIVRSDRNAVSVAFASDALTRLALLRPDGRDEAWRYPAGLRTNLMSILAASPVQSWEALVRAGLDVRRLSELPEGR